MPTKKAKVSIVIDSDRNEVIYDTVDVESVKLLKHDIVKAMTTNGIIAVGRIIIPSYKVRNVMVTEVD
jgi:hypothetical protein